MESEKTIDESLNSTVTFYKKGDPEKVGAMFYTFKHSDMKDMAVCVI